MCMTTGTETFRRNPVSQSHSAEPDQRPEASLAWCAGRDGGLEPPPASLDFDPALTNCRRLPGIRG